MLNLFNLSCISFNIVFVGVESCIFYLAAFMGIIKGCSRDLEEDDDDNDKVDEIFEDFDVNVFVSPIFPPEAEENKNLEIVVVC